MKEIESNKTAWGLLSKDHYEHFKKVLMENESLLSSVVEKELGDISGKTIIHLQCNTGADSISLARKGAIVTGVDLVPENIYYAKKMAEELGIKNIDFFESDIMELKENHNKKYDMVFTTEGVLIWLPDLNKWAETVKHLLNENGELYLLDSHPFFLTFDEEKLKDNKLEIKYPYFVREPDCFDTIGGYASDEKKAVTYEWMYKISDIINPLAGAGLTIENFNEYDCLFFNTGEMENCGNGYYHYPFFDSKLPFTFSLRARLIKR
ncbi:class I SAM-dependent methyltransferase [Breznakiella homolactica]|uniref:Class I SAM-dependent methyltransferase n=1 Tax=Breznakiella homolactica TaxID=2798577 RepID=A0A7T7XP84_9SPIR|nr:class I SAM-dependent methyltransferase [Breznakiella homolactica]QQO09990.1 class I SAM-dependent methyltransferase [Breznakiella homolactica]